MKTLEHVKKEKQKVFDKLKELELKKQELMIEAIELQGMEKLLNDSKSDIEPSVQSS